MMTTGRPDDELVLGGPIRSVIGSTRGDRPGSAAIEPDLALLAPGLEGEPLPVRRKNRLAAIDSAGKGSGSELIRTAQIEHSTTAERARRAAPRVRGIDQRAAVRRDRRRPGE